MPNGNVYGIEIALVCEVEGTLANGQKWVFITALVNNLYLLYSHTELLMCVYSNPTFLVGVMHLCLYKCDGIEFVDAEKLLYFLELVDKI